jgi:hypothetical protein
MTDRPKGFATGVGLSAGIGGPVDLAGGQNRLFAEATRVKAMLDTATPPPGMRAAPVAPARGPQQLVPNFSVTGGGMRRVEGAHWQGLSPLAAAVAQARLRHEARNPDAPFVPPYNPGQVAVAEDYAAIVEWRAGSALRCASLEAGRGGGGSGLFIATFMEQGRWLSELQRRIGDGVAMSVRRHMDRGNGRATITVRAAVDMLVLGGQDLSVILRRFGWAEKGSHRKDLRTAICGALDRMQGYKDASPPK